MYNRIVDPVNSKFVNINSIRGKSILQQYLKLIIGGSDIGGSDIIRLERERRMWQRQLNDILEEQSKTSDSDKAKSLENDLDLVRSNIDQLSQVLRLVSLVTARARTNETIINAIGKKVLPEMLEQIGGINHIQILIKRENSLETTPLGQNYHNGFKLVKNDDDDKVYMCPRGITIPCPSSTGFLLSNLFQNKERQLTYYNCITDLILKKEKGTKVYVSGIGNDIQEKEIKIQIEPSNYEMILSKLAETREARGFLFLFSFLSKTTMSGSEMTQLLIHGVRKAAAIENYIIRNPLRFLNLSPDASPQDVYAALNEAYVMYSQQKKAVDDNVKHISDKQKEIYKAIYDETLRSLKAQLEKVAAAAQRRRPLARPDKLRMSPAAPSTEGKEGGGVQEFISIRTRNTINTHK